MAVARPLFHTQTQTSTQTQGPIGVKRWSTNSRQFFLQRQLPQPLNLSLSLPRSMQMTEADKRRSTPATDPHRGLDGSFRDSSPPPQHGGPYTRRPPPTPHQLEKDDPARDATRSIGLGLFSPSTRCTSRHSFVRVSEPYVINIAPRNALKLIA
jgi:hypothetical protein